METGERRRSFMIQKNWKEREVKLQEKKKKTVWSKCAAVHVGEDKKSKERRIDGLIEEKKNVLWVGKQEKNLFNN